MPMRLLRTWQRWAVGFWRRRRGPRCSPRSSSGSSVGTRATGHIRRSLTAVTSLPGEIDQLWSQERSRPGSIWCFRGQPAPGLALAIAETTVVSPVAAEEPVRCAHAITLQFQRARNWKAMYNRPKIVES